MKYFKITKWSIIATILFFLVFPVDYKTLSFSPSSFGSIVMLKNFYSLLLPILTHPTEWFTESFQNSAALMFLGLIVNLFAILIIGAISFIIVHSIFASLRFIKEKVM